jgi:16S rRNA (adenine1518-N6/adenine1519-N6)-dimethyltransferase
VANLPYNVATPLVMRTLTLVPTVTRLLVMVQREVGERMAAGVGDDGYGAVSVRVAYFARA